PVRTRSSPRPRRTAERSSRSTSRPLSSATGRSGRPTASEASTCTGTARGWRSTAPATRGSSRCPWAVLRRPPGSIGDMSDAAPGALTRADPIGLRAPEVIRILGETYPDATIALHFSNPLELLVATILSAQSTDAKVNEVTAALFQKYRTPEDYLRVPEDELKADIRPTGFYNQKAASIRATCARLLEAYDGQVPDTMEEL